MMWPDFLPATPFLRIDLHSHSSRSDGVLPPAALVQRAADRGVGVLALTDHDDVSGLAEAAMEAGHTGIHFIPGVEISVTWSAQTVHVLGLGIDPAGESLLRGLQGLRTMRRDRAHRIAEQLDAIGIEGSFEGAARHAGNPSTIGRGHFARFLVERGLASGMQDVFKRYLKAGKPGYVPLEWGTLTDAVSWIRQSGGLAVLAHPGRYKLSASRLGTLLGQFKDEGGAALEITGSGSAVPWAQLHVARRHGLAVSVGSDFHAPGESSADLGDTPPVPPGFPAVWELLDRWPAAA